MCKFSIIIITNTDHNELTIHFISNVSITACEVTMYIVVNKWNIKLYSFFLMFKLCKIYLD